MESIKETISTVYHRFSSHKRLVIIYAILTIIASWVETVRISLIYPILNYGLSNESTDSTLEQIYNTVLPGSVNNFVGVAVLLLIVTFLASGLNLLVIYYGSKTTSTINYDTDKSVFTKIKNKEYDFFVQRKQGDLLYTGQGAVAGSANAVICLLNFFQYGVLSLFYIALLLFLSLPLALMVIILGIIYTFIIKNTLIKKIYVKSVNYTEMNSVRSVIYNEFITGIKSILINNITDIWTKRYYEAINSLRKSVFRISVMAQIPSLVNNFFLFFMVSGGAIFLYYYTNGDFYPYIPLFGTFLFGLYRLLPVVTNAHSGYIGIVQQLPALKLIDELLLTEDVQKPVTPQKPFTFHTSIRFENVKFSYNKTIRNTIDGISFEIKKNTKVAIVGSSGAGKTTIANLIAQLYQPTEGKILIDGIAIEDFNKNEYLQALGYIGQESFIFHGSIKENIQFGKDVDDDTIHNAAKIADAHEFIMNTSSGYDTIIGDQGMKLSGGQRQRIAIARVIIREPQILLLDEATSSLDNISEEKVMEAIDRIAKERTVIIIAHRLSTIQNADLIYVMKDGRISESGTHSELMEQKKEYYDLYVKQIC